MSTNFTPQQLVDKLGLEGLRKVMSATTSTDVVMNIGQPVEIDGVICTVLPSTMSNAIMIARGWDKKPKRRPRRR